VVQSPLGNVARTVHTIARDQVTPDYDLVLLTCKTYDLDQAIAVIAPAVGERSGILPTKRGNTRRKTVETSPGSSRHGTSSGGRSRQRERMSSGEAHREGEPANGFEQRRHARRISKGCRRSWRVAVR
jgi:ketopantoate reductase